MKSLFSKVLPLLFVAMLSLAPTNAQAAGPTDGMFDCLGNLDWGCRIIGFLFQATDNDVTYIKENGQQITESPTPAIKALHKMMEFFSNALLIFASIKLLYELIQMTAESAKTGQVGGKDTNQLWAPIRLVIAIGLLVPIANEGGLNSGQLIVIQVAKWGSGMASQGWKLFTTNFLGDEKLANPTPPRVGDLAYTVVKAYACQGFINYYAGEMGLPNDIVRDQNVTDATSMRTVFGNKVHRDICGSILYKVPIADVDVGQKDNQIALRLSRENQEDFIQASTQIYSRTDNLIQRFLPEGRDLPTLSTQNLNQTIDAYQNRVDQRIKLESQNARDAMKDILDRIQNTASDRGWTSAGSLFLDITRAQGQLFNGAQLIPEATGPNIEVFKNYPSAYADYQRFLTFLDNSPRTQSGGGTQPPTTGNRVPTASVQYQSASDFFHSLASIRTIQDPAETIFRFFDHAAIWVGLWEADERRAFGDLGGSNNPFGEIAALGHKKVRLGLNYISYAISAMAVGAVVGIASSSIGGFISGLAPIFMIVASLFLLAGVLLAYIVPMLPFTRFFFSILTWLGSLIEAMVLVPFMALAFLTPKGEGFAGPNTRNAFFLIFQLFLRPILCVFGLMFAMVLFYVAAKFLNAAFYEATISVYRNDVGSALRFMQKLVYSFMYVALIYSAANITFKMIEHLPKHALRWMGGGANEESYDDHDKFNTTAALVGSNFLGQFQSLPSTLTSPFKGMSANIAKDYNAVAGLLGRGGNNSGGNNPGGNNPGGNPPNAPTPPTPSTPSSQQTARTSSQMPRAPGPVTAAVASNAGLPNHAAAPAGSNEDDGSGSQPVVDNGPAAGEVTDGSGQTYNSPIASTAAGAASTTGRTPTSRVAAQPSTPQVTQRVSVGSVLGGIPNGFTSGGQEAHVRQAITTHLTANPGTTFDEAVAVGIQARSNYREA